MTGQQGEVEYMKKLNVALVGFGSLGQSFARILLEKKEEIEKEYETTVNVVAITTKTRGNLVDAWGIDLARVLKNVEETGVFPNQHKTSQDVTGDRGSNRLRCSDRNDTAGYE